MTESRTWLRAVGLTLASMLFTAQVGAQVAVEQYTPAPLPDDGFVLGRPALLEKRQWSLLASTDYANDPLLYRIDRGPGVRQHVISDQVVVHLGAALGLHPRVMLFTELPVIALMHGDADLIIPNSAPDGAGLGDLLLGARILLAESKARGLALATEVVARLPTAELVQPSQRYSGDEIGSYEGALAGELRRGRFDARLRTGLRFRKEIHLQNLDLGQALLFGAGARVQLPYAFSIHAELFGSTYLANAFDQEHTALELLLGPKYQCAGFWFGVAAGPGLVDGYGSPDFRLLGTIGFAQHARKSEQSAAAVAAPDLDGDHIPDAADRCREDAEDQDGFEDADGCPDFDDDRDGIQDPQDRCRLEPEDSDGFEDGDGCPDLDEDGDGIQDREDDCPREPGRAEARGCPPSPAARELSVQFGHVEFKAGRDVSLPGSIPTLQAVQSILSSHPEIVLTRVEGHADDAGGVTHNQDLSERRARAAARWLVAHGIAKERLLLFACGQRYPVVQERPKSGDQRNRRVEFYVLDPAPAAALEHEMCEPIELR